MLARTIGNQLDNGDGAGVSRGHEQGLQQQQQQQQSDVAGESGTTVNGDGQQQQQQQMQRFSFERMSKKHEKTVEFNLSDTGYKAIQNIGTGAYGVVCKAHDTRKERMVGILWLETYSPA